MKMKTAILAGLTLFVGFCGWLVVDAALQHPQQTKQLLSRVVPLAGELTEDETTSEAEAPAEPAPKIITAAPVKYPLLSATSAKERAVTLGAVYDEIERFDDEGRYKFEVELTSKGAAVKTLTLSEFKSRDSQEIEPLVLLSPLTNGNTVYSLANTSLKVAPADAEQFDSRAFPLNKLNWTLVETESDNEARFEAVLTDATVVEGGLSETVLKIIKTYRVQPNSYDLACDLEVENLSGDPIKVLMQMQGPGGISREAVRMDSRKVKAAYKSGETGVLVEELDLPKMKKKVGKKDSDVFEVRGKNNKDDLLWTALTNKYFAAILRPDSFSDFPETQSIQLDKARYYPAPTTEEKDRHLHNCSFSITTQPIQLNAAGQDDAKKSFTVQLYAGPKDKKLFEKNDEYRTLQFLQTIDFRTCCCPQSIIAPLAFGIMWMMNTLYSAMGPLGNYGVVIMFLVFLVRLAMHPITKKSQVSMMKMQKLGPKMQEIQKKYANNKAEMNKQVMAMYREQGVSPISGMLPMFLQMPIWIALWTAVNTSVDLRGAGFLPFWITDLASPDQLFAIPYAAKLQELEYIGKFIPSYFNLLPILMGVVMYLQQKMMPSAQASASTNPQMAQQQKMMMIMMPLMFPIMLYSGPSGVNLYIMSSITAGVIEQKIIRKHLKEKDESDAVGKVPVTSKTGGKVKKKKPKPMFKG